MRRSWRTPSSWHSFLISVERVVLALIINFVLIVLMAYPLSKPTHSSGAATSMQT